MSEGLPWSLSKGTLKDPDSVIFLSCFTTSNLPGQTSTPQRRRRDVYIKRGAGKGWPEECPPIRAANAFGFDLLANFDVTFVQTRGAWRAAKDIVIESDFDYSTSDESTGSPLAQQYAWFWEKGQKIPHPISDNVYKQIRNQVKVSSFLFLKTDPNELLLMTEIPNLSRPWRAMSALIEPDWYPASYPWHCVLELDDSQKRIAIKKGDPLCRIFPVRRDTYFANQNVPRPLRRLFRPRTTMADDARKFRTRRCRAQRSRGYHANLCKAAGEVEVCGMCEKRNKIQPQMGHGWTRWGENNHSTPPLAPRPSH